MFEVTLKMFPKPRPRAGITPVPKKFEARVYMPGDFDLMQTVPMVKPTAVHVVDAHSRIHAVKIAYMRTCPWLRKVIGSKPRYFTEFRKIPLGFRVMHDDRESWVVLREVRV